MTSREVFDIREARERIADLERQLAAKQSEIEAIRPDAERYRYVRDPGRRDYSVLCERGGNLYLRMSNELDDVIDAEMRKPK